MGTNNGPNQMTEHHIVPRSRGGGNGPNVVRLPRKFHENWHELFGNLTLTEIIKFIDEVFRGTKKRWTTNELYELQLRLQIETLEQKKGKKKRKEAK